MAGVLSPELGWWLSSCAGLGPLAMHGNLCNLLSFAFQRKVRDLYFIATQDIALINNIVRKQYHSPGVHYNTMAI